MNMRNAYSKFRIGKQKLLCSLKSPMANPLKLSLSQKPEQNLLSTRETTLRKARLLLQALLMCQAIEPMSKFRAVLRTLYKSKISLWKPKSLLHSNKKILLTNTFENKKFALI